jgi:hypothetical protein
VGLVRSAITPSYAKLDVSGLPARCRVDALLLLLHL